MGCSLSNSWDGLVSFFAHNYGKRSLMQAGLNTWLQQRTSARATQLVGRNPIATKHVAPCYHIAKISIRAPLIPNRSFTATFHAK